MKQDCIYESVKSDEDSEDLLTAELDHTKNIQNDLKYQDKTITDKLKSASLFQKYTMFLSQSVPVAMSFLLQQGATIIVMYFAGHIRGDSTSTETRIFAGVSMATLFSNVTFLSMIVGMGGAVDTLASQFNGDKNYREVGITFQRSVVILSLFIPPALLSWYYVDAIFGLLGVEDDVCKVMRKFLIIRALAMPTDVLSQSYNRYLTAMGVMDPPMYGTMVLNVLLLISNYFTVHHYRLGFEALAWTYVLCRYIADLSVIGISVYHPSVKRSMQAPSLEAFQHWRPFFSLGFPSLVMLCAEWWAFEFLTVMASKLGSEAVAAQTIIVNLAAFSFMIPLSVGITAGSLVGNAIGAGDSALARELSHTALTIGAAIEVLVISPLLMTATPFIAAVFSNDPKVVHICAQTSIMLGVFALGDGMQGVGSGVLRGAGKQTFGAIANMLSFYAVGLPMAYTLCFHSSLGVVGLITGISFGTLTQTSALLALIMCNCCGSASLFTRMEDVERLHGHSSDGLELGARGSDASANVGSAVDVDDDINDEEMNLLREIESLLEEGSSS